MLKAVMTLFGMIRYHKSSRNALLLASLFIRPSHKLRSLVKVLEVT
jgi:hypothetical protein